MKHVVFAISLVLALGASAITATKDYVDRATNETRSAASAYADRVGASALESASAYADDATNELNRALSVKVKNATNALDRALSSKVENATNALEVALSAKVRNATNELDRALVEKVRIATNELDRAISAKAIDGDACLLPRFLHLYDCDDSYPEDAAWYYSLPQDYGGCSAVRDGGFLYRNLDWKFNNAADFVVRMSAGAGRFASVGVANCGTNLTEAFVCSHKPSRFYKCLPGRTVDGINENGVCAEVNVVGGAPAWNGTGDIHPLAAVRWVLDHATSALDAATNLASRVKFPAGWGQNFHYMVADESATYVVENGAFSNVTGRAVLTNFKFLPSPTYGAGWERYQLLSDPSASITNAWFTRCYERSTNPPWLSEFGDNYEYWNAALNSWELKPKEAHRGEIVNGESWWQTVHTSIYGFADRSLRIAVQEQDDWYVFRVPSAGGVKVETDPTVPDWAKAANPPASMPDNGVVLTNGTVKTKSGTAITPGNIGAASAEQLEPLSLDITRAYQYSRTVSLYMTGNTNAWFAGTNYVFGADAASRAHFSWEQGMDAATVPCSMALWEIRDGVRQCVWDQRDWPSWYWSFKAQQMRDEIAATNRLLYAAIDEAVTNDSNHAWAKRYASTGRRNPDASTTFIDTPSVTLSPGMSWETVATVGGCGYWTIVGNGAVIGGSGTNATLNIKDFEGNSILEITKGQHMLAWIESSDFVGQLTDEQHWVCFDMMADVKPTGYFSTTLVAADFVAETDANCPAQYRWEDLGGHVWRVHFLLKPGIVSDACFAKFQVEVEGKTQIRYNADTVINGGLIFDGVKIAPVIQSGAAVGSTVTWKVVQ